MEKNSDLDLYRAFERQFFKRLDRNPETASALGYRNDKYDFLLKDSSYESNEAAVAYMINDRAEIISLKKQLDLSEAARLDCDLMLHYYDVLIFFNSELAFWRSGITSNPAPSNWGPAGQILGALNTVFNSTHGTATGRCRALVGRLEKVEKYLNDSKGNWRYPVRIWVEQAIDECDRGVNFIALLINHFDESLTNESDILRLKKAGNRCQSYLRNYSNWLKEKVLPRANFSHVIGEEKFNRLLRLRRLEHDCDAMREIGREVLAETRQQIKILTEKLFPGDKPAEALAKLKKEAPVDFAETLRLTDAASISIKEFLLSNNLVTIPSNETLTTCQTPTYLAPLYPFAAYSSGLMFAPKQNGRFLITNFADDSPMRFEHNFAALKNKAVHEGYPGHHLQRTVANNSRSLIRKIGYAPEFTEGWAHFCEQFMAEKGWLGEKERLVQLSEQVWRAVRITVDVDFSTGKLNFETAKNLMINEIGMAESAVEAELKRYTASPGYQLSYLYGKMMMQQLSDDVKNLAGNSYSDKKFLDTCLQAGNIPIYFIRKVFAQKENIKEQ